MIIEEESKLMKWTIGVKDLEMYKEKYGHGNAVAGYAENGAGLTGLIGAVFYILVVDDEKITIVELSLKLKEKNIDKIPLSDVGSIKIKGLPFLRKVIIETKEKKVKFTIKTNTLGIKKQQLNLLEYLSTHFG
jgi:hypothetical protein